MKLRSPFAMGGRAKKTAETAEAQSAWGFGVNDIPKQPLRSPRALRSPRNSRGEPERAPVLIEYPQPYQENEHSKYPLDRVG